MNSRGLNLKLVRKKKEQAKYLKEVAHYEKKIAERGSKLDKNVSFA